MAMSHLRTLPEPETRAKRGFASANGRARTTRVDEDVFDRSIDVQILRLRRKLERDPSAPRVIQTERGVGYMFTVPVERI
jgi:DNA-binding response OmpR family regulator